MHCLILFEPSNQGIIKLSNKTVSESIINSTMSPPYMKMVDLKKEN